MILFGNKSVERQMTLIKRLWRKLSKSSLLDMKQKTRTMRTKRVFFKGIPTKSLILKSGSCAGGKKSEDHLTMSMCGSMAGKIRKLLVIGKYQKQRRFKNMDIPSPLPVIWKVNKKFWMTAEITEQ